MIYLDASVVFSLYCADDSSALALSLISAAHAPLLLSALCEFEVVNAFNLCVFRKIMTSEQARGVRRNLERNLSADAYIVRPLPQSALLRAKLLSEFVTPLTGVRAADLLHVAAALEFGATGFYTFDVRQHQAALTAGLRVNTLPERHPSP